MPKINIYSDRNGQNIGKVNKEETQTNAQRHLINPRDIPPPPMQPSNHEIPNNLQTPKKIDDTENKKEETEEEPEEEENEEMEAEEENLELLNLL